LRSVNGRSHYDVLEVAANASASTIRESYRRLAREFHPDRMVGSAAGGDRMPMINEAYRVLSDPGRRAVYDAERRGRVASVAGESTANGAGSDRFAGRDVPAYQYRHPDGPARVPWRSLLFFSGVAIAAIVVLAQFSSPSSPGVPDGILRSGDCVEILANNDAQEVACTGTGDLVLRQFIAFDRVCPNGWQPHRDRQGMGVACVELRPDELPE
jgi:molecular chaperone DnaJ